MFVKLVYLVFFTSLGVAILKYRKNVFDWTGRWYWAEKYLGNGGTVVVIILIGLGLIFFGVGYPLGAFDSLKGRGGVMGTPPGMEEEAPGTNEDVTTSER